MCFTLMSDIQLCPYVLTSAQPISSKLFPNHLMVVRMNGRIDIMNDRFEIVNSYFSPGLLLNKALYISDSESIIVSSFNLPTQLLLFDAYENKPVKTISLDFGQITDMVLKQNQLFVSFNNGQMAVYQYSEQNLQFKCNINVQYPINNISVEGDNITLACENKVVHLLLKENVLVKVVSFKHQKYVRQCIFKNDLYFVADRQKLTVYDKQQLTVFNFNSQLQINKLILLNNFIVLLCAGQIKIFNLQNQKITDQFKMQSNYYDLVAFVQFNQQFVVVNQVGQLFCLDLNVNLDSRPTQINLFNDSHFQKLGEHCYFYVSQNGLDMYSPNTKQILFRLQLTNFFNVFNKFMQKEEYQLGLSPDFIQDVRCIQMDAKTYLIVVSEWYTSQTKFILVNLEENLVINLLQSDTTHKIPNCLQIVPVDAKNLNLVFKDKIVSVSIDLDADEPVQFTALQKIQQIKFSQVNAVQFNNELMVSCFMDDYYLVKFESLKPVQQLALNFINKMIVMGPKLLIQTQEIQFLDTNLELISKFEKPKYKLLCAHENRIITNKAVYDLEMNITMKEKNREFQFIDVYDRWVFKGSENDAYAGYIWISVKIGEIVKFNQLQ